MILSACSCVSSLRSSKVGDPVMAPLQRAIKQEFGEAAAPVCRGFAIRPPIFGIRIKAYSRFRYTCVKPIQASLTNADDGGRIGAQQDL